MKTYIVFFLVLLCSVNACSQTTVTSSKKVGGPCEGCEAIHESPVPFNKLDWALVLPDYTQNGPWLQISGVVYKADGITPARDVVLYIYHTDQKGYYPKDSTATGWGRRHGYLRGWLKTNSKGQYQVNTLKPAPYPGANDAAHIHITVKEPDKNEYWIDEFLFDDDPLLTSGKRKLLANRGGSGILVTTKNGNLLIANRNIYLGKNIPEYPER